MAENSGTNITTHIDGYFYISGTETAGTELLKKDVGVGKTAKWMGQSYEVDLNEIKPGATSNWIETAFATYSTKTNIDNAGNQIQFDTIWTTFQDDFSQNNIDANGYKLWTATGSPTVSGGVLVTNAAYEYVTHTFAAAANGLIEFYLQCASGGSQGTVADFGNGITLLVKENDRLYLQIDGVTVDYTGQTLTNNLKIKVVTNGSTVKLYVADVEKISWTGNRSFTKILLGSSDNYNRTFTFDTLTTDISETLYYLSGTFNTVTHDFSLGKNWSTMTWDENLGAYGSMVVRVQSKAADSGWDLTSAGTVSKNQDISSVSSVTDGHRYMRARVEFSSSNNKYTPVLNSFTVNTEPVLDGAVARTWSTSNDGTTWSADGLFSAAANSRMIRVRDVLTTPDGAFSPRIKAEVISYTLIS